MATKTKKRLTKAQRRVAIAKDVLKWLPETSCDTGYLDYQSTVLSLSDEDNASDRVLEMTKKCSVCALGATMLAYVRVFDRITVGEMREHLGEYRNGPLSVIFGEKQLRLIECYYMNWAYSEHKIYPQSFCDLHPDRKDRLRAIMRNIIKNKGTFIPA